MPAGWGHARPRAEHAHAGGGGDVTPQRVGGRLPPRGRRGVAEGERGRGRAEGLGGATHHQTWGGALSTSCPDLGPAGGRLGVAGSRRGVEGVVAVLCLLVRPRVRAAAPGFLSEEGSYFLPGLEAPWS